jgi:hypothetical protein
MTNVMIDLVLVFWMVLFGGIALLPIVTGGRGPTAHEPEDRVISIAPARRAPAGTVGSRLPLVQDDHQHDRPAA